MDLNFYFLLVRASDHFPMLLSNIILAPTFFHPFSHTPYVANQQTFLNINVAMMRNEEIEGSPMYHLCSKLRRLKEELRRLKNNHFEPFVLPKNPINDRIGVDLKIYHSTFARINKCF
jgi:hypothetical protein